MTDVALSLLTALGLSTAAGLNAYLPLLIVGLLGRYTDLITLTSPYDALEEPLVLAIVAGIGVVDFVGDKIPAVDHVLHAVGLAIAPAAGALVALAATGSEAVEPAVALIVGVVAASATHGARTMVRPASTALTAGAGNPVLSLGEDGISTVLSFAAVIVPVVGLVMVVVLFVVLASAIRRLRRARASSAQRRST